MFVNNFWKCISRDCIRSISQLLNFYLKTFKNSNRFEGILEAIFLIFFFLVCFYSLEFCKTELTAIKRCFSGNGFIDAGSKWTAKTCRNQLKVSFIIAMEQKPLFYTRFVGGKKNSVPVGFAKRLCRTSDFPAVRWLWPKDWDDASRKVRKKDSVIDFIYQKQGQVDFAVAARGMAGLLTPLQSAER